MKRIATTLGIALIAGCGGRVVEPARPEASLGANRRVAVGTPLYVWSSWSGTCEFSGFEMMFGVHWGPGGQTTKTCNEVDYDVTVTCEHDACVVSKQGTAIVITPTKPGVLRAHATMNPSGLRRTKTIALEPVEVVIPDRASASCYLWHDDSTQVDYALWWKGLPVQHEAEVKVAGMESCVAPGTEALGDRGMAALRCKPLQPSIELELVGPGYKLPAKAECPPVLPTWSVRRDGDSDHRFVINGTHSYQKREDFVRMTRERLERWGWNETNAEETSTATVILASKHDTVVEITIAETEGPEYTIYTWSWQAMRGTAVPVHTLAGWIGFLSPGY